MKKSHQIFFIGFVIVFTICVGIGVYFNEGRDMRVSHFIRIELIPKIEFLTDADNIVNSIYPVNYEAEIVATGEEFVGLKITDAVQKFLDESAKLGYLNVDSENSGVQISVSSGFTQSLENKIYKACNEYFLEHEIMCAIAESDADLALYNEKKEKEVSSIEKLVVIKSILEKTEQYSFDDLKSKSESDLINILVELHEGYDTSNNELLTEREDILTQNINNYDIHMANITDNTKREFATNYVKFKKSKTYDWELDFQKRLEEYIAKNKS